jgi:hypothetical protein
MYCQRKGYQDGRDEIRRIRMSPSQIEARRTGGLTTEYGEQIKGGGLVPAPVGGCYD